MTDLTKLEAELAAAVTAAPDVAALEAVRVAALGKSGSISDLLKTLGGMSPDERRERGIKLVGFGEGLLLGVAYAIGGLPRPVLLGALTLAMRSPIWRKASGWPST